MQVTSAMSVCFFQSARGCQARAPNRYLGANLCRLSQLYVQRPQSFETASESPSAKLTPLPRSSRRHNSSRPAFPQNSISLHRPSHCHHRQSCKHPPAIVPHTGSWLSYHHLTTCLSQSPSIAKVNLTAPPHSFESTQPVSLPTDHTSDDWNNPVFVSLAGLAALSFIYFPQSNKSPVHCKSEKMMLANVADVEPGCMYEISLFGGKKKVLLTYVDGEYHCTGAACAHYSFPLHKGLLTKTSVVCPLHSAEFDIKTGKCVNGPCLDGIHVYPVTVSDGKIYANVDENDTLFAKPKLQKMDPSDKRVFAVVGGGASAIAAAEHLRIQGFTGRILMYSKDSNPPMDLPPLSKGLAPTGPPTALKLQIRSAMYITDNLGVELFLNQPVESIDADSCTITLKGGTSQQYDKVLLCTGSKADNLLSLPGGDALNVFTLRSLEDAHKIIYSVFGCVGTQPQGIKSYQGCTDTEHKDCCKITKGTSKRAVIIGDSFIGMEVASALSRSSEAKLSLIGRHAVPFESVLGKRIGEVYANMLASKGIAFYPNSEVVKFEKNAKGEVSGVTLKNGETLQADIVICGIGAKPTTPSLKGVKKEADGGIATDALLRVPNKKNFFVAGDICHFPLTFKAGKNVRVQHYDVAMQTGRVAASNMCEKFVPYTTIPFFWTMCFGVSLRYVGHCNKPEDIIIEGDLAEKKFVAYFVQDDKVCAVATLGMDPVAVAAAELLKHGALPPPSALSMGLANSQSILADHKNRVLKKVSP